jgi:hypothetical protein
MSIKISNDKYKSEKEKYNPDNGRAITMPEWKEIMNAACLWDYGTIHEHEYIANLIFAKVGSRNYRNAVARANKELIQHGKMLKSIRGIGYEVVKPGEYVKTSKKYAEQARKQYSVAKEILECAPKAYMTKEERLEHRNAYDRTCIINGLLNGGAKGNWENPKINKIER